MSTIRLISSTLLTTFGLLAMGFALILAIPYSAREVPVVGAEIIGQASEEDFVRIQDELDAPIRVDLYLSGHPKAHPDGVLQRTFNFNPQYETRGALIVASPSAAQLLPEEVDRAEAQRTLENGGAVVSFDGEHLELHPQASLDPDAEILITPETARSLGLNPAPYGALFAGGKRVSLAHTLTHFREINPILVRNQHLSGFEPYFLAAGAFVLLCGILLGLLLSTSGAVPSVIIATVLLVAGRQLSYPGWVPTWELVGWWVAICLLCVSLQLFRCRFLRGPQPRPHSSRPQ